MNRFGRVGIALALLAGVLLAGGVAEARRLPNAVAVCVDASSGVASRVTSSANCVGGKLFWSASKSAPLLCWDASSLDPLDQTRLVSVASALGCAAPLRSVPVNKVLLLCADGKSGVLRWPVTKACRSGNRQVWIRSATTVAPTTTTTVALTTTTTVAPTTTTTVAPTTTTTVALTCAQGGLCTVGVDTGPGGGIVFYYSATAFTSTGSDCGTDCHYLEAAPSDQSSGIDWATLAPACYDSGSTTDSNVCRTDSIYSGNSTAQAASRTAANALGMGMVNTNQAYARITTAGSAITTSYATGIAWAYTNNSKTDWFLPSKFELNQLCRYAWRLTVNNAATDCTGMTGTIRVGFAGAYYWSSSEAGGGIAWGQNFSNGFQSDNAKIDMYDVRPIRAF